MKVSVIGWELPPAFAGGLGIHTINLYSILSNIIDIDLYVPYSKKLLDVYPFNVKKVGFYNYKSYYDFSSMRFNTFMDEIMYYNSRVIEDFDPENVDLIHAHDWITYPAGIYLKKKYNIPLIVTVHSTEFDRSGNFFPQKSIMDIESSGIKNADRVIAVSNLTKKTIVQNYNADPEKIDVIYNGIDDSFLKNPVRSYEKTNIILYFGRITTQKGPKFFLEAAYKSLKINNNIKFVMAGTGDQLDEMIKLSKSYGIYDNFYFPGFVPEELAMWYYRNADAFILPAVSEPFGMSVIEAMSAGTPVIISRTTGVGESLLNVLTADFWDTDLISDYILNLVDYRSLRTVLGTNGQMEAKLFTWNKTAMKTLEVYRSLCRMV
ncbi:glycosyltransferase family 4 protein [Picrophilus oshimae]|uniref:Glycosyltransferase n=1 Tax=Picrophilus torridus (strain ATCC 700027 / DSM 9790 / JCM 10055 / NBRC 100828 / KAW 2/3) TaxID=1122961 RepID=Q6KZM8_PICTO|nr:glycosyltransferase family 4 protein [Picrophilus oshimae]AAT43824.1 glycosyltransferase [Picrophilus oshimae DSM 9789]